MKFTKMNGAGNDFIIINNFEENIPQEKFSYLAKKLCQRRMSIGADGIMIVDAPETDGDYRMYFYNSDGSLGEMCGNGARCIARYGYEKGMAGETQRIETTAGMVIGKRKNKRQYSIRLNNVTKLILNHQIKIDDVDYTCAYVELGNPGLPHAVIHVDDLKNRTMDSLRDLGEKIRYHESFPKGANVNFYDVVGNNKVEELTYERGVEDFTYACGTGTGSTVAVLTLLGLVDGNDVKVQMPGGELAVSVERQDGTVKKIFLTGPTNVVAEGEILDEELKM